VFGAIWDIIKWLVLDFLFVDDIVHFAIGFYEKSFIPFWHAIKSFGLYFADMAIFLWNLLGDIIRPIIEFLTETINILSSQDDNKFGKIIDSLTENFGELMNNIWAAI